MYPYKISKKPHLNCSTRTQPINKLKLDPNRYIWKLSYEPKSTRSDPEFVKWLIYFMYPSSCIKNPQFNYSTKTQPIHKLKLDLNRYTLELSDKPKNTINRSEPVKQWIYLLYPPQEIKNPHLSFSTKNQPVNKFEIYSNRYNLELLDKPKNGLNCPKPVK